MVELNELINSVKLFMIPGNPGVDYFYDNFLFDLK